jgi:CRP/FNR family transcriptional regulator
MTDKLRRLDEKRQLPRASTNCFTCQNRERSDWCALSGDDLKLLNQSKVTNVYEPGQILFYEGNPCLGIYCIDEGTVALRKSDGRGGSVVTRILGPGQIAGYLAYFGGRGYSSTGEAVTTARICFIDKAAVRQLLEHNPTLGQHFLTSLAEGYREAESERVLASVLPLKARVAHLLLVLKDRFGTGTDEGTLTIDLPLSRRDIASMVAARPESLSRAIRELEDEEVATFNGRAVVVPDLDRLIDLVDSETGAA